MNGCWVTMKKRENPSYPHTLKLMLYPVSSLEKNNHQKYTRRYLYIYSQNLTKLKRISQNKELSLCLIKNTFMEI